MITSIKPNLKIKLDTDEQFKTAWDVLKRMGYEAKNIPSDGARYIYADPLGHLAVDFPTKDEFFKGMVTAEQHFEAHIGRMVTLAELIDIAQAHTEAKEARHHEILIRELPLFEKHIVRMGGDLQSIQWDHELGAYRIQDSISNELEDDVKETLDTYAAFMTSNFYIWLECAEGRELAPGYYVVPMQPTQEMIDTAKHEFQVNEEEYEEIHGESFEDHLVFAHQAMVQTYQTSLKLH